MSRLSAASIQIGLNYRDFPSNWRPARREIAFARAAGFTSMQFHGPADGLDTERLGDSPEVVGALLREAVIVPVMEIGLPLGLGTVPFAAYCRELRARGFRGPAILEIGGLPASGVWARYG